MTLHGEYRRESRESLKKRGGPRIPNCPTRLAPLPFGA